MCIRDSFLSVEKVTKGTFKRRGFRFPRLLKTATLEPVSYTHLDVYKRQHPFRDGNGRMSRLLSRLLLYKNGFDAGKYVSFEEQINNRCV